MLLANTIHLFTYHISVLNFYTTTAIVTLAISGIFFIMCGLATDALILSVLGFCLLAAMWGVILNTHSHHTETRKGVEMQVVINDQKVWIPAKRLADGSYWPITFTRLRSNK